MLSIGAAFFGLMAAAVFWLVVLPLARIRCGPTTIGGLRGLSSSPFLSSVRHGLAVHRLDRASVIGSHERMKSLSGPAPFTFRSPSQGPPSTRHAYRPTLSDAARPAPPRRSGIDDALHTVTCDGGTA